MLIVVRHGQTLANAEQRLLGRLDPPLDDQGWQQAHWVAGVVSNIDRVVSSPLTRCVETARAIGLEPEIDERWTELDYGHFDGMPLAEVPFDTWEQWRTDPDFAPPDGESLRTLRCRVEDAITAVAPDAEKENVVVVTHVSPIKATVGWTLGLGHEVNWNTWVAPGSVTRIDFSPRPVLRTFNETQPD